MSTRTGLSLAYPYHFAYGQIDIESIEIQKQVETRNTRSVSSVVINLWSGADFPLSQA